MKISIVTFFDNGNFGSELQSLALFHYMTNEGNDVTLCQIKAKVKFVRLLEIFVDKIKLYFYKSFNNEIKLYLEDRLTNSSKQRNISPELKLHIHSFVSKYVKSERISRWNFPNKKFDAYVCGSDQIWSALKLPLLSKVFLYNVKKQRKIAYAPSIGVDKLPKYYIKQVKKYICDFKYLSVREKAAQQELKENMGIDAMLVLDPTILVGKEFWEKMLNKEGKIKPEKKYIFCYFLGEMTEETVKCINEIADDRYVVTLPYEEDCHKVKNGKYIISDPLDFVNLIKYADCVLTDSFHATVFSIIYNKPFVVTKRSHVGRVSQTSRITSILSVTGLDGNYCQTTNEMLKVLYTPIDYTKINDIILKEQRRSRSFLDRALNEIKTDINNE